MATLEIHDGQGRVQRVTITREQTVLFGSARSVRSCWTAKGSCRSTAGCGWKKNRYKADASPDAGAIEVNGKRLASSSFRQGDEIVVGPCRIYMIHSDEDLPRDDKTRIQATPFVTTQTTAPAKPRSRSRPKVELERDDWFQDLEVAPPSGELEILPEGTPRPSGRRGRDRTRTARGSKAANWSFRGLYDRFFSTQVAPGEERVLTSPLVFGLVIAVVVLIELGFSLNTIIARTVTTRLFHRAWRASTTAMTATRSAASTSTSRGSRAMRRATARPACFALGQRPAVHHEYGCVVVERTHRRARDARPGQRRAGLSRLEHRIGRARPQDRRVARRSGV